MHTCLDILLTDAGRFFSPFLEEIRVHTYPYSNCFRPFTRKRENDHGDKIACLKEHALYNVFENLSFVLMKMVRLGSDAELFMSRT